MSLIDQRPEPLENTVDERRIDDCSVGRDETAQALSPSTDSRSARPLMWIAAALLAAVGSMPLADNSFMTHMAIGRLITNSGLPQTNPFLFTGTSFPVPSYWWSILLSVVDSLAGGFGLRVLTTILAGILGALVVKLTVTGKGTQFLGTEPGTGLLAVVVPTVFALLCLLPFIEPRPHLAGFILLALMVIVWRDSRSPWWLVPIFVLWVNMHGTWLYGLVVIGLFVAAEAIDDRKVLRKHVELVGASVLGVIVGGALYPDRFALVLLPTRQFGSPMEREALKMYSEWARVGPDHPLMWMMVGLAIISIYGSLKNRRYALGLAVVALVVMGVSGVRLAPIAALALLPTAALGLREVGTVRLPTARAARACTAVGVVICAAALINTFNAPHYDLEMYPVTAVDWLAERQLVGGDIRTVSHDYVGNYLEWRFGAEANTFVDDRPDASTFLDYGKLLSTSPGWRKVLSSARGDVVIWKSDDDLTKALSKDRGWVEAGEFGDFTVFCNKALASRCS